MCFSPDSFHSVEQAARARHAAAYRRRYALNTGSLVWIVSIMVNLSFCSVPFWSGQFGFTK